MINKQAVQRSDFSAFFAALNGGHAPFSWQQDLVDHIVATGRWPDRIVAPTGAGKSSVVDVHLFVNALFASGNGPRVPRRLCVVVGRRALVDSQADRAMKIQRCMVDVLNNDAASSENDVIYRAAKLLSSFRVNDIAEPFLVGHIRGELSNRSLPVNEPSVCAIIAATPDMWGSRLLFKGYGSSKQARPRETALIAMDSVFVLDEAHLNQQLLVTARRVAELQELGADIGVPRLQVVETTATPSELKEGQSEVGVDISNLDGADDAELLRRVNSVKELRRVPIEKWNGSPGNSAVVKHAVAEINKLCDKQKSSEYGQSSTIGCIVNHVDTAVKIASELKKIKLNVELIVGRMRSYDLEQLRKKHPSLFTCVGDDEVDVVVATQTLEVGIDIDFSSLITELAPVSSLTQRFGRVNRLGKRKDSKIVVLEPADLIKVKDAVPPYKGDDLRKAYDWLDVLSQQNSVNPAAMLACVSPPTSRPRLLYQRPELTDLLEFSRTSEDMYAEPDLDLWLHDSLEDQKAIGGIVVREQLPVDDFVALELLKAFPPENNEVFPASLDILRDKLSQLVVDDRQRIKLERSKPDILRRAFFFRDGEVEICTPWYRLHPGDVIIIDRGIPFTTEKVAVKGKPDDKEPPEAVKNENVEVLTFNTGMSESEADIFREFCGLTPDEATSIWRELGHEGDIVLSNSIQDDLRFGEVVSWYAIVYSEELQEDSDTRQEWTQSQGKVFLDDHQNDVAVRAKKIVEAVGLKEDFGTDVVVAAQHHDDGKADHRFQSMLGGLRAEKELAKSEVRTRQETKISRQRSGLPQGWRHEQMSVVLVAAEKAQGKLSCSDLALRIIGCSHGNGRNSFKHTDRILLQNAQGSDSDILRQKAHDLFFIGRWEELIEETDMKFGPYVTAYLEALERAADVQISAEGH
ncbi:type I-U CRISPR-associated helicase/endonuclease Cas3 [Corynebacterium durum]|nr:type I-U CRISPR-associated helicase/endonuclease Cas3 [Corynebacterium durum]